MFDVEKYFHKPFFEREPEPGPHGPGGPHRHEPPRFTLTEDMEYTARLMRETIDRLLKFEERCKRELTDLSKNLTADNVIFKQTMNEGWTTFLMDVKNEINVFEKNVLSNIQMFKTEIETDYATLSDDVRSQVAENEKEFEEKLSDYKESYEAAFTDFRLKYEQDFTALTDSLQEQYNSFTQAANARMDEHNENMEQAFNDYQRKLNTEINMFENTMETNYATFIQSVNTTIHEFTTNWEQAIEQRMTAQDGKISDAEMHMKTNLEPTIRTLIGDMHANGEFINIIEGEVFNDLQMKVDGFGRVSVLYFGAKGDGVTDNTDAFRLAFASGFKLFVPRGHYVVGDLDIPEHCDILFEGSIENTHDEDEVADNYARRYAVMKMNGTWTLAPHARLEGGIFFTKGTAFRVNVADAEHQGINLEHVCVIGDGTNNAVGLLIDASDNDANKTGYLSLSRFNMVVNKCYYGIRIYRPQTDGRHPWITFVTFEGSLTECYQGVSTEYGSIAHANGSGVYRLVCCGGSIYKNDEHAFVDISGDMPVVDCLFSDIGANHSIKYGLDLTGTIRASVHNYPQGHAIFKNKSLYGEHFLAGSYTMVLTNEAMPNAKVYALRNGGMIDYIFTGTFAQGTHVDFGVNSPFHRGPFDTTYRDADTNLLIQMPGNNNPILISNETGADIVLSSPIRISVPHTYIN